MNPIFSNPDHARQLAEGALRVQAVYAGVLLMALLGCALTITLLYYQRVAERRAAAEHEADLRLELELEREDHEKQLARIRVAWERAEATRQRHQALLARRDEQPKNSRGQTIPPANDLQKTVAGAWRDAAFNARNN